MKNRGKKRTGRKDRRRKYNNMKRSEEKTLIYPILPEKIRPSEK